MNLRYLCGFCRPGRPAKIGKLDLDVRERAAWAMMAIATAVTHMLSTRARGYDMPRPARRSTYTTFI